MRVVTSRESIAAELAGLPDGGPVGSVVALLFQADALGSRVAVELESLAVVEGGARVVDPHAHHEWGRVSRTLDDAVSGIAARHRSLARSIHALLGERLAELRASVPDGDEPGRELVRRLEELASRVGLGDDVRTSSRPLGSSWPTVSDLEVSR